MPNIVDQPVIDMKSFIDGKFASGEGVLTFSKDTPDAVILLSLKQAIAVGRPFTVIPILLDGNEKVVPDVSDRCPPTS